MNASLDDSRSLRSSAEAIENVAHPPSRQAWQLTPERLFTVRETAKILGRCQDTVRRHLRSARLSGVRVGRIWRVPASGLPTNGLVAQSGLIPLSDDMMEPNQEAASGEESAQPLTPRSGSDADLKSEQTMALVEKAAHHADLSQRARQRLLAELEDLFEP